MGFYCLFSIGSRDVNGVIYGFCFEFPARVVTISVGVCPKPGIQANTNDLTNAHVFKWMTIAFKVHDHCRSPVLQYNKFIN